jgi:hypothetical protein
LVTFFWVEEAVCSLEFTQKALVISEMFSSGKQSLNDHFFGFFSVERMDQILWFD